MGLEGGAQVGAFVQLDDTTRARVLHMHRGEGHALHHGEEVAAALAAFAKLEGAPLLGDVVAPQVGVAGLGLGLGLGLWLGLGV